MEAPDVAALPQVDFLMGVDGNGQAVALVFHSQKATLGKDRHPDGGAQERFRAPRGAGQTAQGGQFLHRHRAPAVGPADDRLPQVDELLPARQEPGRLLGREVHIVPQA